MRGVNSICLTHPGVRPLWTSCWDCGGEGYTHHDCGEDTCVCLHPELNVMCETCHGDMGYYLCPSCDPDAGK